MAQELEVGPRVATLGHGRAFKRLNSVEAGEVIGMWLLEMRLIYSPRESCYKKKHLAPSQSLSSLPLISTLSLAAQAALKSSPAAE